MQRRRFSSAVILLLLIALSMAVIAQESAVKGNLSGVVLDPTGAVIPQAKVILNGPTGSTTASSGADGRFVFPLLIPGFYSLRVEMQGFRAAELKSVEIVTGRTASVTIAMQPGASGETVEVSDAALTVDTTSSAISTNLNDTFYSQVPVGRNVTSIFYASAGVNTGGGTGAANPSISGGTGLENQYVADGVSITDGAFGGIGVFSRVYGSLSTGINLSFVKEVQVKTSGYEPQYGKSTGGLVQIVTKSGSNEFHGGISGFFAPQQFEAQRINPDDAEYKRLNLQGRLLHQGNFDVAAEIGGYVPRFKNNLFFFGSFNPSWSRQYDQLSDFHGTFTYPLTATQQTLQQTSYNFAGKLTYKLNDSHQIETSLFGDPTRSNTSAFNTSIAFNDTVFSKLANGTRNWVARYNGTLSPTWLVNASFSWGHNSLTETPKYPDMYQVADLTGRGSPPSQILAGPYGLLTGTFTRQGIGYYEDTQGDNYGFTLDTQKQWSNKILGSHSLYLGYRYERNYYAGTKFRTGGDGSKTGSCYTIPEAEANDIGMPQVAGLCNDAAFQLRLLGGSPVTTYIPGLGVRGVALLQSRGEFEDPNFKTAGRYHAAYVNDAWTINKYVTVNIGWRWEQQFMRGTQFTSLLDGLEHQPKYTFTDNWSPRIGLAIDPMGDRKTKIFGNFARYSYAIPLDMAIRSLSNEMDLYNNYWLPQGDGPDGLSGNMILNADGSIPNPILNDANYNWDIATPIEDRLSGGAGLSLSSTTAIAQGTKMQYLQEWVGGVERDLGKGMILNVRFIDRRLKRIVEDMAGISPEAFNAGVAQNYFISNPSGATDLFVNPIQIDYAAGDPVPAGCPATLLNPDTSTDPYTPQPIAGTVRDTFGTTLGAVCIANPSVRNADGTEFLVDGRPVALAGAVGADGKPDGFANPARIYKAVEVELNKSFSSGWQLRSNYRWSQLAGNYEGAFRNDNGQSDPSISSLFDFVQGDFGLLGNQFGVGWLNTDKRHIFNNFVSYNFTSGMFKNLTLGSSIRIETGVPINRLKAHPAYLNSGEIPVGGRGSLGRTSPFGSADIRAEYKLAINDKHSLQFAADVFNITNEKTQLRVDQNEDRSFGVPNVDFQKPTQGTGFSPQLGFQRPFYARLSVKWIF